LRDEVGPAPKPVPDFKLFVKEFQLKGVAVRITVMRPNHLLALRTTFTAYYRMFFVTLALDTGEERFMMGSFCSIHVDTVTFLTMNDDNHVVRGALSPKETLLFILIPMVVTVVGVRLKLHLIGIQHLYVAGYIVRHLFSGLFLVISSAFVLAFVPRQRWLAKVAATVLGIGTALVLDEVVFLIATNASKEEYLSSLSLTGSIIFISLAAVLLLILYKLIRH
jgi:hypothetical protein